MYNYSTYEWEVVRDAVAREKVCQVSYSIFARVNTALDKTIVSHFCCISQALRDAVAIENEKVCDE